VIRNRLEASCLKINALLPFNEESLKNLKDEQIAWLDMLTTRLGKLQDIIGAKIFPLILDTLGENDLSFTDRLNKLEKLHIIQNAHWWMELCEIRNQVTHDYPDSYDLLSTHFNHLFPYAKALLTEWASLQIKIQNLPQ
jgi:hypothetical protein